MKKNAVGRVPMHKEPVKSRLAALHIPARLLCLLLAVVIWLAIVNLEASADTVSDTGNGAEQETEQAE